MANQSECAQLLRRVARDLDVPMALLVAIHPQRVVVAHRGFDDATGPASLMGVAPGQGCADKGLDLDESAVFRSWAAVGVAHDGIEFGTLVVADRRRRWFDDEEVRHMGLMTFLAGTLIADLAPSMIEAVDIRSPQPAVLA